MEYKITIERFYSSVPIKEYKGTEEEVRLAILKDYPWVYLSHESNDLIDFLTELSYNQVTSVIGVEPKSFSQELGKRLFGDDYVDDEDEDLEEESSNDEEDDELMDLEYQQDYMVPDIFNLHAYQKFAAQEPKGIHIYLTTNAIKEVLEKQGAKAHDELLVSIGHMLHKAAQVPDQAGKVFHISHESYYVFMPSYESGLRFLRNLQALTEQIPQTPHFDIGVSDKMEMAVHCLSQIPALIGEKKQHGNYVMIHKGNTTKFIQPSDVL